MTEKGGKLEATGHLCPWTEDSNEYMHANSGFPCSLLYSLECHVQGTVPPTDKMVLKKNGRL